MLPSRVSSRQAHFLTPVWDDQSPDFLATDARLPPQPPPERRLRACLGGYHALRGFRACHPPPPSPAHRRLTDSLFSSHQQRTRETRSISRVESFDFSVFVSLREAGSLRLDRQTIGPSRCTRAANAASSRLPT